MPIIVREEQVIRGKTFQGVKVYKSDNLQPLTKDLRAQAEKLDKIIDKKMREIESEMKTTGLLELKGKGGVIRLWYEIGKRLQFFDSVNLVKPEDRRYLWRALYDHAGELKPGPLSERVKRSPETSHFAYCYRLARNFTWDFVQSAGDWTAWSEFLDSPVIRDDPRIIEWLATKQKLAVITGSKQDWLRKLNREIRRRFKGYDTTTLKETELKPELESIFDKLFKED